MVRWRIRVFAGEAVVREIVTPCYRPVNWQKQVGTRLSDGRRVTEVQAERVLAAPGGGR